MNSKVLGKVVSVNVGQPQALSWNGVDVRTSFRKSPVSGAVPIVGSKLAGDGPQLRGDSVADPEVHGGVDKCIFAFPSEHFLHWEEWLGVAELPPGTFGENLTLDGILEEGLAIGDVVRIGTAVLQVTEPRQPCYKVDMSLERKGASGEMVRSGKIGFYFGLVTPGSISAGDCVELIEEQAERWITPALLHRLNSAATIDDVPLMRQLSEIDIIPEWWRDILKIKASAVERKAARASRLPLAWEGLRSFEVERRIVEAPGVVSLWLAPVSGVLPKFEGGQFVFLELGARDPEGNPLAPLRRCYSLSGRDGDRWRITVRLAPDSRGGSKRVWELSKGDLIEIGAPGGNFCLSLQRSGGGILLASGGIGITPFVTMIEDWIARGCPGRLAAIHATRTPDDNALLGTIDGLLEPHENARLLVHVEERAEDLRLARATVHAGRIGPSSLNEVVEWLGEGAHAYLCGPVPMIDSLQATLPIAGITAEHIHTEVFAAPADSHSPVVVPEGGIEVMFAQTSKTVLWTDPDATLLDLAEAADVEIPSSCRLGVCGTCMTMVLDGAITHVREPAIPLPPGMCLACIAAPTARLLIDA